MKQSEKLDLILKSFYDHRFDGIQEFSTAHFEKLIPLANEYELDVLMKRLQADGYLKTYLSEEDGGIAKITSRGIEYCEESSYTYIGSSLVTNNYSISVNNSSGISIVNASKNININISNIKDVNNKIEELLKAIHGNSIISQSNRVEIIECIDEIKTSLANDKKPKYSFKSLLEMTSDFAGIGSLVAEIGKLIF